MGLVKDALVATAAGYAGTKAMEPVASKLMEFEPEEDQEREREVRPGPPFVLAADNLATRVAGIDPDEDTRQKAGMAFHYLAGLTWAPVYQLLRRRTGMNPVTAGLATGASMWLILDETITPAIGASAPNRDYPLATHLRGFAAHLAFGLAVAATTELVWKLTSGR